MMGKIYVVGIGPGNAMDRTMRAERALKESDVIIGFKTYLHLIQEDFKDKTLLSYGMHKEVARCEKTVALAQEGKCVSLISGGDSVIYGMAGLLLETVERKKADVEVEIIPGLTAGIVGSALLGAVLTHDFAVISLSDLLTPWEKIEKRLRLAAQGDFVICLYNPKSHKRQGFISLAEQILLEYKSENTPVGIVKNAGRAGESVSITKLKGFSDKEIDMFTTVLIGNESSYVSMGRLITPRGYRV